MDVKKLGKIPDGGGWKAHGRQMGSTGAKKRAKVGFDFVHSLVDGHSRLAYSEIHDDEKGDTCAGFLERAAEHFAAHGIPTIERVMTDTHWSYRRSQAVAREIESLGATHKFIRPHCPWQNGKVERFNRTLQTEWAYRQIFTSNNERAAALPHASTTTTTNGDTTPSEATHPSADCHQPDGRVQLVLPRRSWLNVGHAATLAL